jgi:outer membrane receptor protein involved in Fe transport
MFPTINYGGESEIMIKLNAPRLALTASVIALTAAFAAPAYAQAAAPAAPADQPPAPDCTADPSNPLCAPVATTAGEPAEPAGGAIIVTGSRIRRPNLDSPVPITSITQDELTNQGQVSVGDALNDLPALRSTFSQQNSGRFIGTAGNNFLDLRGLGTNRTLVLVNGRRMINASPGSFDVDVDNIPQDLIERVDVVTGGESAIYGSDAVAGVVNFVLKKDYDGFRIKGQAGISKYGDRPVDFVSTTFGRNFADGRGNIAVNLEYTHAGELFFRDRAAGRDACGFAPNPADSGGDNDPTTAGGDSTNGVPDNIFVCGLRNPFVTNGGAIGLLDVDGTNLAFDPTGTLVITPPCDTSFIALGGTCISDDPIAGSTLRETGDLAVGRDRYMANVIGHFDVTDWFKPFVEGMFVHQKVYQEGQPSFFQGRLSNFFGPIVPSLKCSNAFLTPQNLGLLQAVGLCANPATGTIPLNRFNVDWGARKEVDTRDTFRIVTGITGDFNEDWHYELSVNYGHHSADNKERNDLQIADQFGNPAGFALAIDAVRDASGNIVCGVNADADPTNDAPGCVPINPFGEGRASPEAIDYVNTTSHLFQAASQLDFLGFVAGDTSQWFNLQGGPIGFSIGAEYRRETAELHADPVSAAGGTFFNAFTRFDPPPFTVAEIYGEINLPILKDLPFAHELTISGAARRSHYNTSAGNTFTWNANAIWAPISDLRLRGNYSKSVRVPTLGDLFSPASVNFSFVADPCDQFNINDNPNRAANCAALGVPTTVLAGSPCISAQNPVGSPFHNCVSNTQTIQISSQGNPFLKPETGKSITLGGVFTPRFLPGFSFSADYFDIKINKVIATLGAQTIVDLCVDQPSTTNQFCPLIFPRDQFGLFAVPALISGGVNFAKRVARGIDFDLNYRHRFANGNRVSLRGFATYTLKRTNFTDPTNPKVGDRILSELGDPVFAGTAIAGYTMGKFDLRYTLRYIGSQTDFDYEDTHTNPEACTPSGCPPFNSDVAAHVRTGEVWYHDIRVGYTLNDKYNFYLGVDNIFNKLPPLGLTGAGAGSGIYSNLGRFFYAGATLDLD